MDSHRRRGGAEWIPCLESRWSPMVSRGAAIDRSIWVNKKRIAEPLLPTIWIPYNRGQAVALSLVSAGVRTIVVSLIVELLVVLVQRQHRNTLKLRCHCVFMEIPAKLTMVRCYRAATTMQHESYESLPISGFFPYKSSGRRNWDSLLSSY